MAVKRVDATSVSGNSTDYVYRLEYQCLTTDTKPVLASSQSGSTLVTLDATTKQTVSNYIWHIDDWYEVV